MSLSWSKLLHYASFADDYIAFCMCTEDPERAFQEYCAAAEGNKPQSAASIVHSVNNLFQSSRQRHLAYHLSDVIVSVSEGVLRTAYWCLGDDTVPIIFDSGASISCSPNESDFVELKTDGHYDLSGLTGAATVGGIGIVEWTIMDDKGSA